MPYAPDEKEKIETLLALFHDYLMQRKDCEVLYSRHLGYIWLVVDDFADNVYFPIESRDSFLRSLVENVLLDEEDAKGENIDYRGVRQMFSRRLAALEQDTDHCIDILDQELDNWKNYKCNVPCRHYNTCQFLHNCHVCCDPRRYE